MKKEGYYSSGELMKLAHITKKTVRYYDEHNLLKPSYVNDSGARFYTDADLAKLRQILLLKYLGFSLADIREMTINGSDHHSINESLKLQLRLVEDKIEQLQTVAQAIRDTTSTLADENDVDWSHLLELINISGLEKSLHNQYRNANNITSRINLHSLYSQNKTGWFPWIFSNCKIHSGMRILEVGCGDGAIWTQNIGQLPDNIEITLSDISDGMVRDVQRTISDDSRFSFRTFDCHYIPYADNSFDLIIANHILFYCDDIPGVCQELSRVLKPDGTLVCGTYGTHHMKEISSLVSEFDSRIVLAAENLYERFGKENGAELLAPYFKEVEWLEYEDSLEITEAEPLISYVLSCHGNQNQYILDKYTEFKSFVKKKMHNKFHVTKEAGIFRCKQ